MFQRTAALAATTLAFATLAPTATAFDLTPGNIYSTRGVMSIRGDRLAITEYGPSGNIVGTLNVPGQTDSELHGLGFGADGMLYTIRLDRDCFHYTLVQIDSYGIARDIYRADDYCAGNLNATQIAAAPNGDLYIAGNLGLLAVNPQTRTSYRIVPSVNMGGTIIGVAVLPSGNLLVSHSYYIWEMMTDGTVVRRIAASTAFSGIQSLTYDPDTNRIFVSASGSSSPDPLSLTTLDASTGAVLNHIAPNGPGVLALTAGKTLVLASGYWPAKIYDEDLHQLGTLQNSDDQQFVAAMPQYSEMIAPCNPNPQIICANPAPPFGPPTLTEDD